MDFKKEFSKYITSSPEILGGTIVFRNTRVPVKILFDYLKNGENIDEFLDNYPSVNPSFVSKIIEKIAFHLTQLESNNETAA